jgi:uncharacterized protein YhfF
MSEPADPTAHDAITLRDAEVAAFWETAKRRAKLSHLPGYFGAGALESVQPPAWWFGGTPEEADELIDLVLDGTKTATASALWDFEATGEPVPTPGSLSIVVDGSGHPRALLVTTEARVVRFADVDPDHAFAEGEGDRTLEQWREVHERCFTDYAAHDRGFSQDMPVVLERFEVLYQEPRRQQA